MNDQWMDDGRGYPITTQHPGDSSSAVGQSRSSKSHTQRAGSTTGHTGSSAHSSRRHRASHQVTSSTSQSHQESSPTPAFDIKQHPAALAYAAAHPNRTIPKFGPYLLLQTLGEGEFGKVKLGLHTTYGEEVAVKLIRRGNIDSAVRMSKIEREIEVLRSLHHPHIVRLYDVIETDKYIGIILEYASGGELFDHILAHRYLREKDACKLFAQLISAVQYIHQKKIVHRDLKLENLLLDRNRNVIVTDFGFANRFEHRSDDLMQTSCGSPCYAAPELVVSEGLYVGSAVDIWSCGVILYAMLAGYLPYDDDPANPEGDNINLLYKYILNTQLTFPDYVSASARDLLSKMLVPQPENRADIKTVMAHEWLRPYAGLFDKSVEDMELLATESQHQKRAQNQKLLREREKEQRATRTHRQDRASMQPTSNHGKNAVYAGQDGYGGAEQDVFMAPVTSSSRRAVASAIVLPTAPPEASDDIYMQSSTGRATGDEHRSKKESKKSKSPKESEKPKRPTTGFRHTIQLEYDDGGEAEPMPPTPSKSSKKQQTRDERQEVSYDVNGDLDEPVPMDVDIPPVADVPHPLVPEPAAVQGTRIRGSSTSPALMRSANTEPMVPTYANIPVEDQAPAALPTPPVESTEARPSPPTTTIADVSPGLVGPPQIQIPAPQPIPPAVQSPATPSTAVATSPVQPPTAAVVEPTPSQPQQKEQVPPPTASAKSSRHGRGISMDRFGLGKLLHGKDTSASAESSGASSGKPSFPSRKGSQTSNGLVSPVSTSAPVTPPAVSTGAQPSLKSKASKSTVSGVSPASSVTSPTSPATETGSVKKKGRKALSLVVDPINRMKESRSKTRSSVQAESSSKNRASASAVADTDASTTTTSTRHYPPVSGYNGRSATQAPSTPSWRLPGFGSSSKNQPVISPIVPSPMDLTGGMASTGASTKSQSVMDWFRKKSLAKERRRAGMSESEAPRREGAKTPTQTEFAQEAKTPTVGTFREGPAPSVVVTAADSGSANSGSQQGSGGRATMEKVTDAIKTAVSPALSVPVPSPSTGRRVTYNKLALRLHDGPVDTSALSSAPPAEIIAHVLGVLRGMGIEYAKETDFKYRCVRPKRRKPGMVVREPSGSSSGIAAFNTVGSAASNGVDKRGLPAAPPSSFAHSGMLKFFSRRSNSSHAVQSSSSLSFDNNADTVDVPGQTGVGGSNDNNTASSEALNVAGSSAASEHSGTGSAAPTIVEPIYGDRPDQGDEVRFSVEVTRLDRFEGLLSLDIRRLKGHLKSYKFLYDTIRERCDLPR